jgi:6-pyruvoyltetrahydropterin/6-carboxytetrahydropterin synthase
VARLREPTPYPAPGLIRVTRRYRFSASHRLWSPELSAEENSAMYGKCSNPYGHGHDYTVEVTAVGPVDPVTGLALRVPDLDRLVKHQVLERFDHRDLNQDAAAFSRRVPTTENLAAEIERSLHAVWREAFPGHWPRLERVRIWETERNLFEVQSEG